MKDIIYNIAYTTSLFIILIAANASQVMAKPVNTVVKGSVIEKSNKEPLAFATIVVTDTNNKIVRGATTSQEGTFSLASLPVGEYGVQISFMGFKTIDMKVNIINDTTIDLGILEIEADSEQINAAVITAKVPLIEQKLDKVVMNVSESVMAKTNNGFEILRKAPGISVDPDGNILLNGQAVDIWIDGRPSRLSGSQLEMLLSALDGNSIDKLEIMQHPSSKFDASGSGGIINIKTKKNFINGFYGNASLNYNAHPYSAYQQGINGSVNLNYRSKKTNTYVTYSPRWSERYTGLDSWTLFGENKDMQQYSTSKMQTESSSHYAKAGTDFYINEKNTIGGMIATTIQDNHTTVGFDDSHSQTYKGDVLQETSVSKITTLSPFNSIDANLYYTYTFNETSDLTINADYNYFDIRNDNSQFNRYFNSVNGKESYDIKDLKNEISFKSFSKQFINIYSIKGDYKQLFLKKGMFETGVKYTRTLTHNDMIRKDSLNGEYIDNNELSSRFKYTEDIAAAYLSLSYQFNQKWSSMAGLRAEYTHSTGDWQSADTVTKQSYINFFPTIYVGYMPSKDWRLSLSYSIRIRRPAFSQLNPYREYIDANSSLQGNPELKPQLTHQIALMAGYKSFLNFGFICQLNSNFLSQDPTFSNTTGDKLIVWTNFGKFSLIGGAVSLSEYPLIKEKLILNINGIFSYANSTSSTSDYSKKQFFYQLDGVLTWMLPKNFKIEVNGRYQSGLPYGTMNVEPLWQMDAGIKKNFWDNKATLTLAIDDIFRSGNTDISMYEGDLLTYSLNQNFYSQKVKIGFTYKFGKVQAQQRKNKRDDTSSRVGGSTTVTGL